MDHKYDVPMTQEWICKTEDETAACARDIGKTLPRQGVVCLYGNLGAGKTAFCRALIRSIMHDDALDVPSPTYTLVQNYDADDRQIWHFDLYRLNHADDIYDLGWEDAVADGLCLIEWPERLDRLKPRQTIDITITVQPDQSRHIKVSA